MTVRRGHVFVELVVTLAVSAILAAAFSSMVVTQLQAARTVTARVQAAMAARVVFHVLPAELRLARPWADIRSLAGDSVAARLPRLSGSICGRAAGRLWIRVTGLREPDVRKDSVLVVSATGELAFALAGASEDPAGCAPLPGFATYRIDAPAAAPGGGAVVVFESGSYYLRERALRFRIGAEGRQPLTEEVFLDGMSGLAASPDSTRPGMTIRIAPRPAFGQAVSAPASASFRLINPRSSR
jgi:hypothetical protein